MNVVATRAAEGFPRRSFTVAEIRRAVDEGIISEDEGFELIEGDLVARFARGNDHEIVKAELVDVLARRTPDGMRLAVATSLYLAERTFVEPDICLYPRSILPEAVKGPDVVLAIEVAGTSLGYDRGLKARIYAQHGVRELWVLEAESWVTWVHRRPFADGQWGSIERVAPDTSLAPAALPAILVRMAGLD